MVMGRSDGTFDSAMNTEIGPVPIQMEKADFNRDGNLDLAILGVGTGAHELSQSLYVLQGNGLGGFQDPFVLASRTEEDEPAFAIGDLNGDGWQDLALLEPGMSRVRIIWNGKTEEEITFQANPVDAAISPGGIKIVSGKLNGDGFDDLALISDWDGSRVDVLLSDGAGGLSAGGSALLPATPTCITLGRIDGDENLDVVVGVSGGEADLFQGDGKGDLGEVKQVSLPGTPSDVALGDLDGNGLLDLVLTQPELNLLSSILVKNDEVRFIRGDANGDLKLDISDAVSVITYLFLEGTTDCPEALDGDDDGEIVLTDAIFILHYLFLGGPQPGAPFPVPGPDPDPEGLGCERS